MTPSNIGNMARKIKENIGEADKHINKVDLKKDTSQWRLYTP